VWNDQAYDHLVYDEQQKDLVMSFVESHGHMQAQMEDVILGKGAYLYWVAAVFVPSVY
jgi:hypothetical protein